MPGLAVYVPEADIGPVMQEPGLRAEILMLQSTDGLVYGVNRYIWWKEDGKTIS